MSGKATAYYAFEPGENYKKDGSYVSGSVVRREPAVLIPENARVYAFTTLGDDELNLSCALQIQRLLLNCVVDRQQDGDVHLPVICPCIRSDEVLDSVQHLTVSNNGTRAIHPFGSSRKTFTYKTVIDSAFEKSALQLSAAYSTSFGMSKRRPGAESFADYLDKYADSVSEAFAEYNKSEVNKLSSRCSTYFVPYRLWMLGYPKSEIEEFINVSEQSQDELKTEASKREMLEKERDWFKCQGIEVLLKAEDDCTPEEKTRRRIALKMLKKNKPRSVHAFDEYVADEEEYRRLFPVACAFSDMEHARWLANYEALGWTSVQTKEQEFFLKGVEHAINPDEENASTWRGTQAQRKSEILHRHSYMVSNAMDQLEHGYRMDDDETGGEDPFALDRIINTFTIRILYRRATRD